MMRQIKWGSKGLISESSEKWRTETVETPTLLYWFTLNSDQIEWFFWFPISINENLIIKSLYDLGLITLDVQPYFQFHCFFFKEYIYSNLPKEFHNVFDSIRIVCLNSADRFMLESFSWFDSLEFYVWFSQTGMGKGRDSPAFVCPSTACPAGKQCGTVPRNFGICCPAGF